MCGIVLIPVKVPLQYVHLYSELVSGEVCVAVRAELPVKGVYVIFGNDLAGGKVVPYQSWCLILL